MIGSQQFHHQTLTEQKTISGNRFFQNCASVGKHKGFAVRSLFVKCCVCFTVYVCLFNSCIQLFFAYVPQNTTASSFKNLKRKAPETDLKMNTTT